MNSKTLASVSVREYLASVYEPDCDYVDGEIEERNVGEKDHSKFQFRLQMLLGVISGLHVFPEVRIQVAPTRFRVPDIAVYLTEPDEQVFTSAPFLVIEILSPEDRMSRLMRKLNDYYALGCRSIWVIDPQESRAYEYDGKALAAVRDALTTANPAVTVNVADIFSPR